MRLQLLYWRTLYILCLVLTGSSLTAQHEAWYIEKIAQELNGRTEVAVDNGRIDIVTKTHAIEVEKATNWKHSIGQSLWYALQTNLSPGIVLIMTDEKDWNMGMRLNSTLHYAGLFDVVKVWYYPYDFDISPEQVTQQFNTEQIADPNATGYWLSSNSNVRHNKTCRWYTQSKGRYCGGDEGRPCGNCGG